MHKKIINRGQTADRLCSVGSMEKNDLLQATGIADLEKGKQNEHHDIAGVACGLIFFTLLAIMVIAVGMTLKWSYVALKEERRKMKEEKENAGSNVGRNI